MFSEYDSYLESDFGPDYWSDEGISYAIHLLSDFEDGDWHELAIKWRARPTGWKVRCAETIDSHPSTVACSILVEMLESPEQDLVVAAADSLRSMIACADHIPAPTLERIASIRDTSGPATKAVLGDFLKNVRRLT